MIGPAAFWKYAEHEYGIVSPQDSRIEEVLLEFMELQKTPPGDELDELLAAVRNAEHAS